MKNKILNITNGEYFNDYFLENFGEESVPFCEVMMDGDTTSEIFSESFINLRAKELNVSEQEYHSKMHVYNKLFNQENAYSKLCLWFGKDTFCQLNLLTLLAFLEQINYRGEIALNYINDDTFETLQSDIDLSLGNYQNIYKSILINKIKPQYLGVLIENAIDLYFDYKSSNGTLARAVKENLNLDEYSLIVFLLKISKEYGLSDIQAKKLIDKYKDR